MFTKLKYLIGFIALLLLGSGTAYAIGVQLPASIGTNGQVLKVVGSQLQFATDLTGSGGGSTTTIFSNIQVDGPTFTFSTSSVTGLNFNITGNNTTKVVTFSPQLQSGYVIPLSASTTQWSNLYNNLYTRLTVSTSTGGSVFFVSTSSPGNLTINFPSNLLSTTTAAATYEPIQTKGNLTESVTGLEFDATRQVIGGAAALSLTSGYNIPLTASTTNWNTAYNIVNASSTNWNSAYTLSHAAVTLAGQNYLSLSAQQITAAQINLTSHVTGVLPISNGGTGTSTAPSASQLLVGNGSGFDYATLPSCSDGTNSKLLYNSTTRAFSCGTDQSGGSGSLSGGTVGFVGVWASSTSMTTGVLRDNGTVAGVNATSSSYNFYVRGTAALDPFAVASTTGINMFSIAKDGTALFTNGSAGTSFPLVITPNERVGVGSVTPISTLAVKGSGSIPSFVVASSTGNILFQIDTSGNVGIGTTTPGANLSVVGTLQTTGNATIGGNVYTAQIGSAGGTSRIGFLTNQVLFTAGSNSSRFNTNGFGIGGIPTNALDVFGGAAIGAAFAGTTSPSNGLIVQGSVGIGTSSPVAVWTVQGTSSSPSIPLLAVASSTGTVYLRVDNNGSTTLSSLGTGPVYSSSGSLFNNGTTGTGLTVQQTSPTLTTPILGVASSTSLSVSGVLWGNGQTNLTTASATAITVSGLSRLASTTITGTIELQSQTASGTLNRIGQFTFNRTTESWSYYTTAGERYLNPEVELFKFYIENPAANEKLPQYIANATSTITKLYCVNNKGASDYGNINLVWDNNPIQATSSMASRGFTSFQSCNGTSTPTSLTLNGSSTINTLQTLQLITSTASSSGIFIQAYGRYNQ